MSDATTQPLTEEQRQIFEKLPTLTEPMVQAFGSRPFRKVETEDAGDQTAIAYSLNMAQSHVSLLAHEAEQWRQRALTAEKRLAALGAPRTAE